MSVLLLNNLECLLCFDIMVQPVLLPCSTLACVVHGVVGNNSCFSQQPKDWFLIVVVLEYDALVR